MIDLATAQQFLMTRGLDFGLNLLAAIVLWFVGRWAIRIGTRLLGKVVRRSGKVDPTLTDYLTSVVGKNDLSLASKRADPLQRIARS
jgi:small conductance mechanosensitive channel